MRNISTCVHRVMKHVTFGFTPLRASLLEYRCCLIIWVHWCLLPLWHSGVSNLSTFMICSVLSPLAVLFLEFWKRRQFQLQYEWDTLGFEAAEVCAHYYSRYTLILLWTCYRNVSVQSLLWPSKRKSRTILQKRNSASGYSTGFLIGMSTFSHQISCGPRLLQDSAFYSH